jgi:hypothetical protein
VDPFVRLALATALSILAACAAPPLAELAPDHPASPAGPEAPEPPPPRALAADAESEAAAPPRAPAHGGAHAHP